MLINFMLDRQYALIIVIFAGKLPALGYLRAIRIMGH